MHNTGPAGRDFSLCGSLPPATGQTRALRSLRRLYTTRAARIKCQRIRHSGGHTGDSSMPQPANPWPYPQWVAHRGAGRAAPENTLAAFRLGASQGFRMMEYDVKLSADDVPILLHDDTLDRTSDGKGRAADYRFSELARHDFGGWHSAAYAGEPVATLYGIAAYTRANGIHSNIEIKPTTGMGTHTGEQIAL